MRAVLSSFHRSPALKLWLRQRYGERREADRAAVRDDAGGEWVQQMAAPTAVTSPAPLTPGAVVTGEWSSPTGARRSPSPASGCTCPQEAGNLLLWIKSVEEAQ